MRGMSTWIIGAALCGAAAPSLALTPAEIDRGARYATHALERTTRSLASNRMRGRDNDTVDSRRAQHYLLQRLKRRGAGVNAAATGIAAYRQPFERAGQAGTNLFAVIRGRELPDEYVIVGAHYDHLDTRSSGGGDCSSTGPSGGEVCNGATDNATGVAMVLAIGSAIRRLPERPRRSVILALWDAEEDGLLGSAHYVENPLVPLAATTAYVNFDIQGATLLPSLRNSSFAVGSETGGSVLRGIVDQAIAAHSLEVRPFSYIFGQLRSDYASFGGVGIPTVFFSDSTGGCYHTTGDDVGVVSFDKLKLQSQIAYRTVVGLAEAPTPPTFVPLNPLLATFEDAQSLHAVLSAAFAADLNLFSAADQALITGYKLQLDQIIAAGAGAFDSDDINTVLGAAVTLIGTLTNTGCQRF